MDSQQVATEAPVSLFYGGVIKEVLIYVRKTNIRYYSRRNN